LEAVMISAFFGRRSLLTLVLGLSMAGVAPAELPAHQATPAQSEPSPAPSPLPGETVPEFDAVALAGRVEHVDFPKGSATVLLFFLSGCPHCHKMIPHWNRAFERKPKDLRVYGVILDQEPPGFFAAMPVSFPVLRSPGRSFTQGIKVFRTPTALRIAGGGVIEDVQVGVIDALRVGELFRPVK
jgi:thiol-disulfide isomerase/thioredoxin